jgi:hypothetical protein
MATDVSAATGVNAEQASKGTMCRPTPNAQELWLINEE